MGEVTQGAHPSVIVYVMPRRPERRSSEREWCFTLDVGGIRWTLAGVWSPVVPQEYNRQDTERVAVTSLAVGILRDTAQLRTDVHDTVVDRVGTTRLQAVSRIPYFASGAALARHRIVPVGTEV